MATTKHFILLLLFALPLTFFPFTYLSFELPKIFLLYLFTVSTVYFLLISGYKLPLLRNLISLTYLLFLAWIIFSSILGLSFPQSFWGSYFRMQGILTWFCYGLLFFISGKVFEGFHFKIQACWAITISATFAACLALAQFISLWVFGHTLQLLYSNRVLSTFGQPNFLGAYLVMSLPFVWFMFKHTQRKWKGLVATLMIILILAIFSTVSRSAYLALAVLAIFWGIYHYKLLLTGVVFSVLFFGIMATVSPNLVYQQWYRFKVDTVSKWSAENRLVIAEKSTKLISKSPIIGYGLENFSLAFPTVLNSDDLGLKDIVVDSAHNIFLDIAVQSGLVGLGLFIAILTTTIISGLKSNDDFIKICLSVVITFLVIHQFSPYSVVPMVFFFIALGVINGEVLKHSALTNLSRNMIRIIYLPFLTLTVLFMIQTIRADNLFHQASAYEVVDIKRAITLDNEAIKIAPWVEFYKIRRDFLLKQLGY